MLRICFVFVLRFDLRASSMPEKPLSYVPTPCYFVLLWRQVLHRLTFNRWSWVQGWPYRVTWLHFDYCLLGVRVQLNGRILHGRLKAVGVYCYQKNKQTETCLAPFTCKSVVIVTHPSVLREQGPSAPALFRVFVRCARPFDRCVLGVPWDVVSLGMDP